MTMDDHDFDRKARQLYTEAARETPHEVRQRLRTALATPRPSRQVWQPMVAFAAVAVFAIGGLWLQRPMTPAAGTAPVATIASAATPVSAAATVSSSTISASKATTSATAAYDNDPEFYAWLGNDAPPVPGK